MDEPEAPDELEPLDEPEVDEPEAPDELEPLEEPEELADMETMEVPLDGAEELVVPPPPPPQAVSVATAISNKGVQRASSDGS